MINLTDYDKDRLRKIKKQSNDLRVSREGEDWILEPLIPTESIIVLDGLGGSGKSWFSLDIAYSISIGLDFLGKYPVRKKGAVFYFTAEETPRRFVNRLDMITQAYGDNENFYWISTLDEEYPYVTSIYLKDGRYFLKTQTADAIEFYISEDKPILVVLDSLINFYGLDENNSSEAKRFYEFLTGLIKTYHCSFLLLHHQTKDSLRLRDDDGVFRGSIVFREQARQRLTYRSIKFEQDGKTVTARKVSIEKANYYSPLLEEFPIYLRWSDGIHIYDKQFEEKAKHYEEGKKKFQAVKVKNNKQDKQGERNNGDSTNLTGKTF
jgi:RecA-family ATPase